jgi:S1-C subfamily serine protease
MAAVCPFCNILQAFPDSALGKEVRCPNCRRIFAIAAKRPVQATPASGAISSRPPAPPAAPRTAVHVAKTASAPSPRGEKSVVSPAATPPKIKRTTRSRAVWILAIAGGVLALLVLGAGAMTIRAVLQRFAGAASTEANVHQAAIDAPTRNQAVGGAPVASGPPTGRGGARGEELTQAIPAPPPETVVVAQDKEPAAADLVPIDLAAGQEPMTLQPIRRYQAQFNNFLKAVVFTPDGRALLAGGDGGVRVWDMTTGEERPSIKSQSLCLALTPDGKRFAVGWLTRVVRLWDLEAGSELKTFTFESFMASVHSLAFSPNGKSLAIGSGLPVQLVDVESGTKRPLPMQGKSATVNRLDFSPEGDVLAVATTALLRWDMKTEKELPPLQGHKDTVWCVRFSHAGTTLASGSADRTIRLWNASTGEPQRTLAGHTEPVCALAFTRSDRVLVSGAGGVRFNPGRLGEIKVWDVVKGIELARLTGHTSPITGVAVSPDGITVAAVERMGMLHLWDIGPVFGLKPRAPTQVAGVQPPAPTTNPNPSLPSRPSIGTPKRAPPPEAKPAEPKRTERTTVQSPPSPMKPAEPMPVVKGPTEATPADDLSKEVKPLPSTFSDVCLGGGGRFLILHLPKDRKLAVFDIKKGRIVKYLPVAEDDVKFAAGLEKLVVVLPTANVIQRYSLETLEREAAVPSPVSERIRLALMGAASRGPLMLFAQGDRLYGRGMSFVDPETLRLLPGRTLKHQTHPAYESYWRLSGDARVLTCYQPRISPQGQVAHIETGSSYATYDLTAAYDLAGHITPGQEGRYLYTARGLFTSEGKPVGKLGSYSDGRRYCVPAAESEFLYLRIDVPGFPHGDRARSGALFIHLIGEEQPLAELRGLEVPPGINTWDREPFGHDKRFYLVPSAKRLVYLPPAHDQIEMYRVDVDELLAKSGRDYLVVLSRPAGEAVRGREFAYTPEVKSRKGGVKVKLEAGPPGMHVSAEGKVTWKVPTDFAEKAASVILTVSDASAREIFHTFKVEIAGDVPVAHKPPAEPSKPAVAAKPPEGTKAVVSARPEKPLEASQKPVVDYLEVTSQPPESFTPGKSFVYAPTVRSRKGGVRVKLDAGPKDMTISAEGKISWSVPADFSDQRVEVILIVSDATGQEIFHAFRLKLHKEATATTAKATETPKRSTADEPPKAAAEARPPGSDAKPAPPTEKAEATKTSPKETLPSTGGESIPAETVMAIKAATVFVKVDAGQASGSGTGFLIMKEGETAYLVTNHHVIKPPIRGGGPRVSVVFWSGTAREKVAQAEVVASDSARDLAILKVTKMQELPEAIDFSRDQALIETMPVYIFGFPFGDLLTTNKRNPAITVGKGTVSSIRQDERDQTAIIQLDGDVNPGNSGGPVVDARGRLVGVAVAAIRTTRIGFAIPREALVKMLNGRVENPSLTWTFQEGDKTTFEVSVTLIDPMNKIKEVSLCYLEGADSMKDLRSAKDGWPMAAGCKKVKLALEPQSAKGKFTVSFQDQSSVALSYQLMCVNGEGKETYTAPSVYRVAKTPSSSTTEAPLRPADKPVVFLPPARIELKPPALDHDKVICQLPGTIADVGVGGDGRFLILHLPQQRQLALFDANEGRVTKYLDMAEDRVCFAAGMDRLMVAYPGSGLLQRWNLMSGEKEATVPFREGGTMANLVMGSASSGPLLVCTSGNRPEHGDGVFINPATFRPVPLTGASRITPFNVAFVRASADGTVFSMRTFREEMTTLTISGSESRTQATRDMQCTLLLPSHDGRFLYSSEGIFDSALKRLHPQGPRRGASTNLYLPARHGNFILELQPRRDDKGLTGTGDVALLLPGQYRPLLVLRDIEGVMFENARFAGNKLHHDKRIHLMPDAKLLVTIPPTNDRLILHRFDLDELLAKSDTDYLFITSQPPSKFGAGESLGYQIAVKSRKGGVKYRLESGPRGMQVSATGNLSWQVPADFGEKQVNVLLAISDGTNQEVFQSFTLALKE